MFLTTRGAMEQCFDECAYVLFVSHAVLAHTANMYMHVQAGDTMHISANRSTLFHSLVVVETYPCTSKGQGKEDWSCEGSKFQKII